MFSFIRFFTTHTQFLYIVERIRLAHSLFLYLFPYINLHWLKKLQKHHSRRYSRAHTHLTLFLHESALKYTEEKGFVFVVNKYLYANGRCCCHRPSWLNVRMNSVCWKRLTVSLGSVHEFASDYFNLNTLSNGEDKQNCIFGAGVLGYRNAYKLKVKDICWFLCHNPHTKKRRWTVLFRLHDVLFHFFFHLNQTIEKWKKKQCWILFWKTRFTLMIISIYSVYYSFIGWCYQCHKRDVAIKTFSKLTQTKKASVVRINVNLSSE